MSASTSERINRAAGFHRQGDFSRAESIYREVLAEDAGYFDALHLLGVLLIQTGRPQGGVERIDRALAIRPDSAEALSNRGYALTALNRLEAALASCDRALAIKPDYAEARNNRGVVLMKLKRFAAALADFDRAVATSPDYTQALNNRGNALKELKRLDEALASYARALAIQPDHADALNNRGGDGFKIGVAWQGRKAGGIDRGRSFALAEFFALSRLPNVRLISLQKGDGVEQLRDMPEGMAVETPGEDFDAGDEAFLDTAAVMENLDLVISSDTAAAHLAGALGRPVWLALKQVPDWRWMLDRTDSPWYPTMRLFRQRARGDWKGVFAEIESALRERILTPSATRAPGRCGSARRASVRP